MSEITIPDLIGAGDSNGLDIAKSVEVSFSGSRLEGLSEEINSRISEKFSD